MARQPLAESVDRAAAAGREFLRQIPLALVVGAAALVYSPILGFGFVGDDFQWWQRGAAVLRDPAVLVAPFGGFRPAFAFVMALQNLAFGASPLGYHAVSLALFLACAVLIAALLRRLGCGPLVRAAAAALWLFTPYCTEPVLSVASSLYLWTLACWLGLALLWPGEGERWRVGGAVGAIVLAAFTVGLLESWVVLPGFALVFELGLRRSDLRTAIRRVAWTVIPVAAYVGAYFWHPPFKVASYYSVGAAGAAKIPHIWASFLDLTTLRPLEIGLGAPELFGVVTLAAFAWLGFLRRSRTVLLGFSFFLLPLLPLIPVPFVPTRYTTIPFVGFLIVIVGVATALAGELRGRGATVARVVAGAVVAAYLAAGLLWVRSEIADRERLDGFHKQLLAEAARFAPSMPRTGVVAVANCDRDNPLGRLAMTPLGLPKAYYVRRGDPYGLVDTAALWSWVLYDRGATLYRDVPLEPPPSGPFTVVVHEEGRFVGAPANGPLREAVSEWRRRGCNVRLLTPW